MSVTATNAAPMGAFVEDNDAQAAFVARKRRLLWRRRLLPLAALLALLVLLIEWQVYHRRMQVPTVMGPVLRRKRA